MPVPLVFLSPFQLTFLMFAQLGFHPRVEIAKELGR